MNGDYNELTSIKNLFESWRAYRKGKSRKKDVMEFERHLEDNLFSLHEKLKAGKYSHAGYSHFRISDPKKRDIWKAAVGDRIVHHALYEYLCKIYEPLFIDLSFSSRKNKGTCKAVLALSESAKNFRKNKEKCLAMKCDIRKYFENINHKILLEILRKNIGDDRIFILLKIIIESFNENSGKGIPLGNITSQIFANIYLNELDKFVTGDLGLKHYVRYNDDFIVLESNKEKLFTDIEKIRIFLKEKLSLELPKEKTIFRKLNWGIDFCGCIILPNAILLRHKTKGRMFEKIKATFRKLRAERISLSDARKKFDSYFGLLSHCRAHNLRDKIRNRYLYEHIF
jgi:retron-type reverse transcriptase